MNQEFVDDQGKYQSLFAVFVQKPMRNNVLKLIRDNFIVRNNKVFMLLDQDNPSIVILTFNGTPKDSKESFKAVRNLISIHRKKESNTLFTVNALNLLIKSLNNGKEDLTYSIDWNDEKYRNTFIISSNSYNDEHEKGEPELRFIKTQLKTIVRCDRLID